MNETTESSGPAPVASEQIGVAILVPSRSQCETWFAQSLTLACTYLQKHYPECDQRLYVANGTLLPQLRTQMAQMALKDGADWLVWFDSDMRFPMDTIERLLAHQAAVCGANYPTRRWPAIEPTTTDTHDVRVYTEQESTGLAEVGAVGMGCTVIHHSVFGRMLQPWFDAPFVDGDWESSEDVYFCKKARNAGFKVHIDHDLSKEVKHIGQMEFGYLEALACRPRIETLRPRLILNGVTPNVHAPDPDSVARQHLRVVD